MDLSDNPLTKVKVITDHHFPGEVEESNPPKPLKTKCVCVTWRGDLQVCGLLDVGSSWSGVKGRNQGRKLPLEDKVIVPRPPAASFGLVLLLLL